ncbi:MAG: GDYXXLXY domain-containing protein [Candidatus Omnitrophica bacterium]|nr:GDYXXLXY domain-containing protein [Candidatus Omnitrophota bacterium]
MRKELTLGLFICLIIAQASVPLSMIFHRESILKNGAVFLFRGAPVDPFDAFRGRYVTLSVEEEKAPRPEGIELRLGNKIYGVLEKDAGGFARIARVSVRAPDGAEYITARVAYLAGEHVFMDLGINRYYMEESKAPLAEKAYRENIVSGKSDVYVKVRVLDGEAVVEGLYIGGERIEEILEGAKKTV